MQIRLILILLLLCGGVALAQSGFDQAVKMVEKGQYDPAIDAFYNEIKINPKNAEAWRELGVAFYKKGDFTKAEDALKQAIAITPDARANLFLGLTYEKQEDYSHAIDAYRNALSLKPGSAIKKSVGDHLNQILALKIRQEASAAVENEKKIKADTIPENTIAVVDFDNSHLPPDLAPLGKGMAEFTAIDLAKVKSLRVVDRMKIDMIMNELKLSSSQYADPKYGPRVGRLVGGRHIVTGSITGLSEKEIRLDGALVSMSDSSAKTTKPSEGNLEAFFKVQKAFVFEILDKLGITPTSAEHDSIMKTPTQSYLAFLAYSRGLDFRDRGQFREASQQFQQAAAADKKFGAPRVELKMLPPAPSPGGGTGGGGQFEASVISASDQGQAGNSDLGDFQTGTLGLTGFIRDPKRLDQFGNSSDAPARNGTAATIIIRGNFDVTP
jgi:tetratricopeptide (TPR) repeat protein